MPSAKDFKIGKNCEIDQGVILGYRPTRPGRFPGLIVGEKALIRRGTVIYRGTVIGKNLVTGHNVVIREENLIGDDLNIWSNSVIDYGCKIGSNVRIHSVCYIAQFTTIEDDVFMAPGVMIANDIHPGCEFSKKCMRGPTIKKGASIGVNVTILPFVTIGENALVGSGSVVTKDVPAASVVWGNPARVHKSVYDLKCVSGLTDKPYK